MRAPRSLCILALLLAPACQSAYYATMEKFGVHKRDLLVEEVEEGRAEQKEAAEQFQSTYEVFRDHVLFLKHNLNAKAIAALQDVVINIEDDVAKLIAEMQKSIAEADEFLKAMES